MSTSCSELPAGTVLQDRFEICEKVGGGGFSLVYKAHDLRLEVPVAIKQLTYLKEDYQSQFSREAQTLAKLRHSNVVKVHDFFPENDGWYIVMEFIEGQNLSAYLEQLAQQPTPLEAIKLILPIVDALKYLHEQQPPIIHGDIKPGNILIAPDKQVYLVDFGLAAVRNPDPASHTAPQFVSEGFSAPEQYSPGHAFDYRADYYSLGATLYTMLNGRIPPLSTTRPDVPDGKRTDPLQPLEATNKCVSSELSQVVMKMMATDPARRYESAACIRKDLDQVTKTLPDIATTNTPPNSRASGRRTAVETEPIPVKPGPKPEEPTTQPPVSPPSDEVATAPPSQPQPVRARSWIVAIASISVVLIAVFVYSALSQPSTVRLQGIRPEYFYTGAIDWKEDFRAPLFQEPDIDAEQVTRIFNGEERVIRIFNGDNVVILNEDIDGWYQVEVQESTNPEAEGSIGWIQRWIVDDMNVPPPLAGCEDVPPPLNARLRPSNCVEQSDTLRVDAYMFQPNEKVVYRIINPNGESVHGELTTDTDANGDFAVEFRLENYEPGHWRMEFEGADDQATVYFFVRNP